MTIHYFFKKIKDLTIYGNLSAMAKKWKQGALESYHILAEAEI